MTCHTTLQIEETGGPVAEIIGYIRRQFVDGKVSTAKALVMDCVIVAQNRSCIMSLDKGSYCKRMLGVYNITDFACIF